MPSTRLLLLTSELCAHGGVQAVSRLATRVLEAWRGAAPRTLSVITFRDVVIDCGIEATVVAAGGSRWRVAMATLAHAPRAYDTIVLVMHLHLGPLALPLSMLGADVRVFLHGVEAWQPLSFVRRLALSRARGLIANSSHTARAFREANPWFQGPIVICPLGITDAPPCDDASSAEVLMVGRMSADERYKGHDLMLRIWPGVLQRHPSARLVIVGDGDDRPRIEGLAASARLTNHVVFSGPVSTEQLQQHYCDSALVVLPSRSEGFGLVLLEAMRAGRACIAGRGAADEVMVDGTTGLLVDPDDDASVLHALERLLGDAGLRQSMGQAARTRYLGAFTDLHFLTRLQRCLAVPAPDDSGTA